MKKIEVGMIAYVIPVGANNTRHIKGDILGNIKEARVSKIGRKYFYLEGSTDKFNISDLKHDSEHHCDLQAYLDKQDILDEIEFAEIRSKIKDKFNTWGKLDLSLEQLRAINKIISNNLIL